MYGFGDVTKEMNSRGTGGILMIIGVSRNNLNYRWKLGSGRAKLVRYQAKIF